MKYLFLILLFCTLLFSCAKSMVKVKNSYSSNLEAVKIGSVEYGTVKSTEETVHKEVTAGDHDISIDGKVVGKLTMVEDTSMFGTGYTLNVKDDSDGSFEIVSP